MEAITLLLSGVLFFIAVTLLYSKSGRRAQFIRMMEKIPGPPAYPLIGTVLPFLFIKRNEVFAKGLEIMKSNPPLFRTWLGPVAEVNLTRPEHVEVVLSSIKHLDKAFVYEFLHQWLGTGLLTATGQKWHSHRKTITPTFHFKILDNFVEVFSEKSETLINKLQKEVGGSGFDVYPYITKCALDIICETAMGTPIYAQDDGNSDYVAAVYDMSEIAIKRMLTPWLHPNFIFRLSQIGRRHDECLKVLHGFTNKVIRERKAQMFNKENANYVSSSEDEVIGRKKRKAFLDLLLEASLDGAKLTDDELREEVDTFMFEGHDTTSAGMCWVLYLLGLHQDVQEFRHQTVIVTSTDIGTIASCGCSKDKAYEELDNIFQGSDRSPTMKDLCEMKYLERVIKESLRLYPSVPMIARHLKEDLKIGDYTVPAGCTATLHIYHVHRNPDQFPQPEKFNPDNFLPERVAKRHPYAYIPFSAGPRNCIGQKFALLEEKTVLSYILRHYKVTSLEKPEDITLMLELILRPEQGIKLCITPRKMKEEIK